MSYNNYTTKILGIKDVKIEKVEESYSCLKIYIKPTKRAAKCPCCGNKTNKIHDYRKQSIADLPILGKETTLVLKKRRFICKCGKKFLESYSFLPKYYRHTQRFMLKILEELKQVVSFSDVAKRYNISVSTAIRIFDIISYPAPKILPKILSIDEFRGNTGKEKYQVILTDIENHRVIDILPERFTHKLSTYFKTKDRSNVKYFVSDMWKPYKEICESYFKNSKYITDRFHYTRLVVWAFENVRKDEQKRLSKTYRQSFKRSKSLLIKHFDKLSREDQQAVNVLKKISYPLSVAHYLKEEFYKILSETNPKETKKLLSQWILQLQECELPQFNACAQSFCNWSKSICNSIEYRYSNGFTEGCNNKIKVLKRNAYGYKNFKRFRNRILHIFSNQYADTQTV